MTYDQFRQVAGQKAHPNAPALVLNRFLRLDSSDRIVYDGVLSLVRSFGPSHPHVRKVMYLVWCFRDPRVRGFILDRIAGPGGKWSLAELSRKENADYFVQFQPNTRRKTRSNLEFFLRESGIVSHGHVNLGLDDGWLSDAMAVLAHEEPDKSARAAMVRDPVGFLFSLGWNGLANIAKGEGGNTPGSLEPTGFSDDRDIPLRYPPVGAGQGWTAHEVLPPTASSSPVSLDLVELERANRAHQELERLSAAAILARGFSPVSTSTIDMYFAVGDRVVLLEMKSCHADNIHSQIRKGVGQLLEYRYASRKLLGLNLDLALVLESQPIGSKAWLVDYLFDLGICPVWKVDGKDELATSVAIPSSLVGIVNKTK
jgi:hypothetical protein